MTETQPNADQKAELARLKGYFPFRVVWGAINPSTGEWRCAAAGSKCQPNKLARDGWRVWYVQ